MIVTENGSDDLVRFLGILAILDVLGTVVTLALALFGNRSADDPGARVRIRARLEQQVAAVASQRHVSRQQVVTEDLERYFSELLTPRNRLRRCGSWSDGVEAGRGRAGEWSSCPARPRSPRR